MNETIGQIVLQAGDITLEDNDFHYELIATPVAIDDDLQTMNLYKKYIIKHSPVVAIIS